MFKASFQGGTEMAARLHALPDAVSRKVQLAALRDAAEPIRNGMQANAPRGGGTHGKHLAESMTISDVRASQSGEGAVSVAVGPAQEAFWGFFQEFGHGPGPAQPFARPVFDTNAPIGLTIIGQRLWDALRKAVPASPGGGRFD